MRSFIFFFLSKKNSPFLTHPAITRKINHNWHPAFDLYCQRWIRSGFTQCFLVDFLVCSNYFTDLFDLATFMFIMDLDKTLTKIRKAQSTNGFLFVPLYVVHLWLKSQSRIISRHERKVWLPFDLVYMCMQLALIHRSQNHLKKAKQQKNNWKNIRV